MRKNIWGFSLLEIVIVVGILGVLGLGMTQMLSLSMKTASYLEDRIEYLEVRTLVRKVFEQPQTCPNTIVGKTFSSTNFPLIDGSNSPFLSVGNISQSSRLRVLRTELQNPAGVVNGGSGMAQIVVTVERIGSGGGPKGFRPIAIDVPIVLDPAGVITSCPYASNNYIVSLPQLNLYIGTAAGLTGCVNIVGGPEYFYANTACSRFCNQSCTVIGPYNCKALNGGPVRPPFPHKSGLITECNGLLAPNMVTCSCFN